MLKSAVVFASSALTLALFAPEFLRLLKPAPAPAPPPPRSVTLAPPPAPAPPPPRRFGERSLAADAGGQYSVDALVAGFPVKMLVDTGATMVVISAEVADRLGLNVEQGRKWQVHTANGDSVATETLLSSIDLGGVYMSDVAALIADRSAGPVNLLGASFLKRLGSVEQRAGVLTLRPVRGCGADGGSVEPRHSRSARCFPNLSPISSPTPTPTSRARWSRRPAFANMTRAGCSARRSTCWACRRWASGLGTLLCIRLGVPPDRSSPAMTIGSYSAFHQAGPDDRG